MLHAMNLRELFAKLRKVILQATVSNHWNLKITTNCVHGIYVHYNSAGKCTSVCAYVIILVWPTYVRNAGIEFGDNESGTWQLQYILKHNIVFYIFLSNVVFYWCDDAIYVLDTYAYVTGPDHERAKSCNFLSLQLS